MQALRQATTPLRIVMIEPREVLAHLPMPVLAMTGAGDSQWRRDCARELAAMEKTDEPTALGKILDVLREHAPQYYETTEEA